MRTAGPGFLGVRREKRSKSWGGPGDQEDRGLGPGESGEPYQPFCLTRPRKECETPGPGVFLLISLRPLCHHLPQHSVY